MMEESQGMEVESWDLMTKTDLVQAIDEMLDYIHWLRCEAASTLCDLCRYLPEEAAEEARLEFAESTARMLEQSDSFMDYVRFIEEGYNRLRDDDTAGWIDGCLRDLEFPGTDWYSRRNLLPAAREGMQWRPRRSRKKQ